MSHHCHAEGCERPVKPKLLMCYPHWKLVPLRLQRAIWAIYRKGQEIDKRPSAAYMAAQRRAVAVVARAEGKAAIADRLEDKAKRWDEVSNRAKPNNQLGLDLAIRDEP